MAYEGFITSYMDYSKDALLRLVVEYPNARASILMAYFAGLHEERLKN